MTDREKILEAEICRLKAELAQAREYLKKYEEAAIRLSEINKNDRSS